MLGAWNARKREDKEFDFQSQLAEIDGREKEVEGKENRVLDGINEEYSASLASLQEQLHKRNLATQRKLSVLHSGNSSRASTPQGGGAAGGSRAS